MSARDAAPERPDRPETDEPSRTRPVQEAGRKAARPTRPAPDGPSDEELVRRVKEGDRAAMRRLVERHQRRVYQLALGIVKDHEEALDVVQETFIKVHRNLAGFKGDSAWET